MGKSVQACIDRVIPPQFWGVAAAKVLIERPSQGPPKKLEAAAQTAKLWRKGRVLRVCFLDGVPEVQEKVKACAREWAKWVNLTFDFGRDPGAEIRISFALAGSWSAVGTDTLVEEYFPKGEATMNFGWLRPDTPQDKYPEVVLHEFGHAIGLIHEHQSPSAPIKWNKKAIYSQLGGPPNHWSRAEVDRNMFEAYEKGTTNYTAFDEESIMLYAFPKEWTRDGTEFPCNTALSKTDKEFAAKLYPKP